MNVLLKIACFTTLTDADELQKCGRYDVGLVYASFARQVVVAAFVFFLFLYALIQFFPLSSAIIGAGLLAGVVSVVDQVIVGSEWSLHHAISKHWFINGPINFLIKIVQVIPRVAYAVCIALVIATIAEVAIQNRAIDRILRDETRTANLSYYEKRDAFISVQRQELARQDSAIGELENAIKNKNKGSSEEAIRSMKTSLRNQQKNNANQNKLIAQKRDLESGLAEKVASLSSKVSKLGGQIERLEKEKNAEANDPDRGAYKGARWRAANLEQISKSTELALLQPLLEAEKERLRLLSSDIKNRVKQLNEGENIAKNKREEFTDQQSDKRNLSELKRELDLKIKNRKTLITEQKLALSNEDSILKSTGFINTADYGPLDRYVGLNKLYADQKYGDAARNFSLGLKIFIILVELAPVLVTIFFSPFSFYGSSMRTKRDKENANNEEGRLERKLSRLKMKAKMDKKISNIKTKEHAARLAAKLSKKTTELRYRHELREKRKFFDGEGIDAEMEFEKKRTSLQAIIRKRLRAERGTETVRSTLRKNEV